MIELETAQQILAACLVACSGVIVVLARYIVKSKDKHTVQLIEQGEEAATRLEASYNAIREEQAARRDELKKFLSEVLETAGSMSRALDENTKSQDRLVEMVQRWKTE